MSHEALANGAELSFEMTSSHVASRVFGDAMAEDLNDFAVASDGSLVLGGHFFGMLDFGGANPLGPAMVADAFVARLDENLELAWQRGFGFDNRQYVDGVAIDCTGNVIAFGGFVGDIDLGGGIVSASGLDDAFLVKIAP